MVLFSPEDLARRAAELGMPAVAMTDRDGLYGAARFVDACRRAGVRPILGSTLTVRDAATGRDSDATLLARLTPPATRTCAGSSPTRTTTGNGATRTRSTPRCWRTPRAWWALLGPDSVPGRHARAGRPDRAAAAAAPFGEAFGRWAFVSVRNRLEPAARRELRALLRLAADAGLRPVATNGVRYLVPGDAFLGLCPLSACAPSCPSPRTTSGEPMPRAT